LGTPYIYIYLIAEKVRVGLNSQWKKSNRRLEWHSLAWIM